MEEEDLQSKERMAELGRAKDDEEPDDVISMILAGPRSQPPPLPPPPPPSPAPTPRTADAARGKTDTSQTVQTDHPSSETVEPERPRYDGSVDGSPTRSQVTIKRVMLGLAVAGIVCAFLVSVDFSPPSVRRPRSASARRRRSPSERRRRSPSTPRATNIRREGESIQEAEDWERPIEEANQRDKEERKRKQAGSEEYGVGRTAGGSEEKDLDVPSLAGMVTDVKDGIALINLGTNQGVKAGMTFVVSRDSRQLGYLDITDLAKNAAAGFLRDVHDPVKARDKVKLAR